MKAKLTVNKNSIIDKNNEVYTNYEEIIEKEIEEIKIYQKKAIFFAISPSDSTKLSISPNSIETALLNNIRKNDILMNYAPNKYFLILFDLDINSAEKLWTKISQKLNNKLYAGITVITNQKKEQLINEVLNKLHRSINYEKNIVESEHKLNNLGYVNNSKIEAIQNFKIFKKNFEKQFEQIIIPAFYQAQQNYQNKLTGVLIEQEFSDLKGTFIIKNSSITREFIVTCPGYSKVNIDILYRKDSQIIDSKRITLEPEELEGALFQDLLEQFIIEYKKEASYDF